MKPILKNTDASFVFIVIIAFVFMGMNVAYHEIGKLISLCFTDIDDE